MEYFDFNDDDLVNAEIACQIIGGRNAPIHKATLYRMVARGKLPKPMHPTPGIARWRYGVLKARVELAEAAADELPRAFDNPDSRGSGAK